MAGKRYSPLVSEVVVRDPVLPMRVMVTPGRAPPCSSLTAPVTVPSCVWANAGTTAASTRRAMRSVRVLIMVISIFLSTPHWRAGELTLLSIRDWTTQAVAPATRISDTTPLVVFKKGLDGVVDAAAGPCARARAADVSSAAVRAAAASTSVSFRAAGAGDAASSAVAGAETPKPRSKAMAPARGLARESEIKLTVNLLPAQPSGPRPDTCEPGVDS